MNKLAAVPTLLWIGNHQVPAAQGETLPVIDPATEQVIAEVANAGSEDWLRALELADAVQYEWAGWAPRLRSEVLHEIFVEVMQRKDEFATVISSEMGKPYAEALGEVAYGAEYFRWFAEEAVRIPGRIAKAPAGTGTILVDRTPVGPVLAITPWNFPLAMATRKIAPALAAGCPIIVKPAAETPLTMLLLGKVIAEVFGKYKVPSGVVSIITTLQAAAMSEQLMADSRLRKVTFTGSTAVGKQLVRQSADCLQRTSMELGGNAPCVIAADADLDLALGCALQAKMRNGGEACIAVNRFFVHEDISAEFIDRFTQAMAGYRIGHGLEPSTTLGPMITAVQRDRIAALVDNALAGGAQATTGGIVPDRPGFFYPATVLVDVPNNAAILHEEIFGPVATVSTFTDLEDAVARANDTQFGLAAYGFSENVHCAQFLAENLRAGMIGINRGAISDPAAPFGGVKESGFGREGGTEGIEEYLNPRYIAWT